MQGMRAGEALLARPGNQFGFHRKEYAMAQAAGCGQA
jgi:hypothetical protein